PLCPRLVPCVAAPEVGLRALAAPGTAPALVLAEGGGYLLRLASRSGLPSYVVVEVGRSVWPFFPCGAPEVGVYDAAGRELDRKAVALSKWERPVANVFSSYECYGSTTLLLGRHVGPVTFRLMDDGEPILVSSPVELNRLPDGAALDEQPTVIGALGSAGGALLKTLTVLG